MAVVAFTAASVPNFGVLLDLVGCKKSTKSCLIDPTFSVHDYSDGSRLPGDIQPFPGR